MFQESQNVIFKKMRFFFDHPLYIKFMNIHEHERFGYLVLKVGLLVFDPFDLEAGILVIVFDAIGHFKQSVAFISNKGAYNTLNTLGLRIRW